MFKNFIIFFLFTITSCVAYKKYKRQEIIEQNINSQGKVTSKKFRQWISNPAGDRLATLTQEFDTFGRVIKEYGFDNPYTDKKNYFVETFYQGTHIYLQNKYIWRQSTLKDPAFKFNYNTFDSSLEMFSQNIYPDSTKKHKEIRISLYAKGNGIYYGQFEETFPNTEASWTSNLFSFEIDEKKIAFDANRKLILTEIRKK